MGFDQEQAALLQQLASTVRRFKEADQAFRACVAQRPASADPQLQRLRDERNEAMDEQSIAANAVLQYNRRVRLVTEPSAFAS